MPYPWGGHIGSYIRWGNTNCANEFVLYARFWMWCLFYKSFVLFETWFWAEGNCFYLNLLKGKYFCRRKCIHVKYLSLFLIGAEEIMKISWEYPSPVRHFREGGNRIQTQHTCKDFVYSTTSLIRQSAGNSDTPLGHIILIPSQSSFTLTL